MIKEITPFLHASLYPYGRIETFEQLDAALSPWMLDANNEKHNMIVEPKEREEVPSLCVEPSLDTSITCMQNKAEALPFRTEPCCHIPEIYRRNMAIEEEKNVQVVNLSLDDSVTTPLGSNSRFSPRKPDTLFWSMYIAQYGVGEFRQIGNKYMNKEIEEKVRVMEFLGANRSLQKSMKMSVATGQEIMGDLMTNRQTTLSMIPAFAMYYQSIIWLVSEDSKTYLEFLPKGMDVVSDDTPIHVLYRSNRTYKEKPLPEYTVETQSSSEAYLAHIRKTCVKLDSAVKPLKGIGSYKMGDLEILFDTLGVVATDNGQKWKKGDLYSAVLRHVELAWI